MSLSTVIATIQDPSGQTFANGTWQLVFKPAPNTPGLFTDGGVPFTTIFRGSLDGAGSFSQSVARNDTIAPAGSRWTLTVAPNANSQAFSVDLNVNSGAFNASAAINAVVTNIVVAATNLAHAYKDIEIIPVPGSGGIYYDVTRKTLKIFDPTTSSWLEFDPASAGVLLNPPGNALQTINGPVAFPQGGVFGGLWSKMLASSNSILQLEDLGTRDNQLIGFGVEQFCSPVTSPAAYFNFGQVCELLVPIGNTVNFTGQQTGTYGTFSHFGSGPMSSGFGGGFEGFNPGPATALLIGGVQAVANNGGVVTGVPLPNQTPTNNGVATNLRAFDGLAKNWSSGTVTNGVVFYAEAPQNVGGGIFTNAYGLFVADMVAATNNFAIKTGIGKVEFGDVVLCDSTLQVSSNMGIGNAPLSSVGLIVLSPPISGVSQFGIQSAIQTTSGATTQGVGIVARADTAAAVFTQNLNVGIDIQTPSVGAGSTITEWNGVRIEAAPTAGTKFAIRSLAAAPAQFADYVQSKRLRANQGTNLVIGDFAASGGFGTTGAFTTALGRDQAGQVTITPGGAGIAANPTVTLTFHDGTWTTAPIVIASRGDLQSPAGGYWAVTSVSATQVVFTFVGLPVSGTSYVLQFVTMGV